MRGSASPFARGQRFIALLQLYNFCLLYASGIVSLQGLLNRIQQILVAEWLGEKFNCSRLHGPHSHRDVAVGSDEDNGSVNVGVSQFALELKTAYPR